MGPMSAYGLRGTLIVQAAITALLALAPTGGTGNGWTMIQIFLAAPITASGTIGRPACNASRKLPALNLATRPS